MAEIEKNLPDHPVSILYLCIKHTENSYNISMNDVRAALLYLNEDGKIFFDEVGNVLLRPLSPAMAALARGLT